MAAASREHATTRPLACVLAVLAAACGSIDPSPTNGTPVPMVVLSYDSAEGTYRLVRGEVRTLKFLRTLEGDAAKLLAGADIRVDYDELDRLKPASAQELKDATYKTLGSPVNFSWFESNGTVHPEDFHSLGMATTYYNFERAHLHFAEDLASPLYGLEVQYFPRLFEGPSTALRELADNAFWDPVIRTFAVLPFKDVKELPLGMNLGVVAHEYTHAIFDNRVFKSDGVPWLYQAWFGDPARYGPAMNAVASVNEGLADFFGAAVSGDPAFLRKSLSAFAEQRRLDPAQPRCLARPQLEAVRTEPHGRFNPYVIGSVLAAALWETSSKTPERQRAFERGLLDGMTAMAKLRDKDDAIGLPALVDALASTVIADLKPRACGLLADRLGLAQSDLPSCDRLAAPERPCGR